MNIPSTKTRWFSVNPHLQLVLFPPATADAQRATRGVHSGFSSGVCEAYNRHLMHSGYTIHHARHICGVVMCHSTHSHLCSHHLRPSHDRYVMIGVVMILRKKRFVSEQNTRTRARARRPPACRRAGRRMCRPAWSSRGTCGARAAREKRPPVSTGAARPDGKG